MADTKKFTAKIRSKGLDSTGVTEELARNMAVSLGSHTLAIVDLAHATTTTDADGHTQVALVIDQCEPVPAHLEDRLREFQRALYRQRPEVMGQAALRGVDDGPTPDAALDGVTATIERDDSNVITGIWDGNPDTPLTDDADALQEAIEADDGEPRIECPFPDCALTEDHAGDHADRAGHNLTEQAEQ